MDALPHTSLLVDDVSAKPIRCMVENQGMIYTVKQSRSEKAWAADGNLTHTILSN